MATATARGNDAGRIKRLYNPYQDAFRLARQQRLPDGRRAFNRLSLFAGRRGGKTDAGGIGAVEESKPTDTLGWCCGATYPDLHDYVVPAVLQALPRDWILPGKEGYSAQHQELRLINRSRIGFRSLDDPDKGRGPGLNWAWIDEGRKIAELAWLTLLPALIDKRGIAWLTTSPNGFDWTYKRFWLPAQLGEPGYWACKYKTSVNPAIDPEEIEMARRSMDAKFFQQEFEADFVSFAGTIYDDLECQILHTYEPEKIQKILPEWPRIDPSRLCYAALDPGADHPFGAGLAIEVDEHLVFVGEHLARNKSLSHHHAALQRMLSKFNPSAPFVPQKWAIDRSQRQWQIELMQPPYHMHTYPAPNDVLGGITRVQKWLSLRRLWFIEELVPRTCEQLRGYVWDERNYDDKGRAVREKPRKENDDLPDMVRYLLMTLPEPEVQTEGAGVRDIKDFDESVRWAVERMRRVDAAEREGLDEIDEPMEPWEESQGGTIGDFWGTTL